MKIKHPLIQKPLGLLAAMAGGLLRSAIDWKAVYVDPTVDPVHPRFTGRYVYVGWHEYMLMPIMLRGHPRMLALASEHGDGAIVSRAMRHLGWSVSRGSTSRGGASAVLRYLRDDQRCPNLTPDGPRGPRRVFQQGSIFLASKLGLPLVCVGYGYDRPWRMRSWDRFAVPRPFSWGRAVFGPPLRLPDRLDRAALERYRLWFEDLLNWLTTEAENWAESGRRRRGEMPMLVRAAAPMLDQQRGPSFLLPDRLTAAWSTLGQATPSLPTETKAA